MFPDRRFTKIQKTLDQGVQDAVFAAAQAAWCTDSETVILCAGNTANGPTTPRTQFDIASITKVFATSACLRQVSKKVLRLESPIRDFLRETPAVQNATLEQLLSHEAGFCAWLPLFEEIPAADRGSAAARSRIIAKALRASPIGDAGRQSVYSDLGFIVLVQILEESFGQALDDIIEKEVCRPLQLFDTFFRPLGRAERRAGRDIAPTETCPWRGRTLQGEVHDDNAWTMGGVSAHAGLFSTAKDVAEFGRHWLFAVKDGQWLPKGIARQAIERRPLGRGLGWDVKSKEVSSAGDRLGDRTFGHLGYTGCSLWIDPDHSLSIALLTNRVHFGRNNDRIRTFRPTFYNTIMDGFR